MTRRSMPAPALIERAAHVDALHDARVVERSLPCATHARRQDHFRQRGCLHAVACRARAPALTKACLTDAAVAKFASKMLVMTMGRLLVSIDAICCAAAISLGKHLVRG